MVSKKGVAMVVACCPAAQHRRSLCEDDSLAAPVYQFLSELYLGGNSAGVCPVNPAQTPVDRGSGFRGAAVCGATACIPLPPN